MSALTLGIRVMLYFGLIRRNDHYSSANVCRFLPRLFFMEIFLPFFFPTGQIRVDAVKQNEMVRCEVHALPSSKAPLAPERLAQTCSVSHIVKRNVGYTLF